MRPTPPFSNMALAIIEQCIQTIRFGDIIFIVQDGNIVQIERSEKFIIPKHDTVLDTSIKKSVTTINALRTNILAELSDLKYGQLVVRIKNNRAVQFEKTEKRRYPEVEGTDGDGI